MNNSIKKYGESMVNNGFDPGRIFMPPVGAIERIEVIRGPASTIYGSDAAVWRGHLNKLMPVRVQ
jgi:outer membrane receptor for ferrienterochelin and colicin